MSAGSSQAAGGGLRPPPWIVLWPPGLRQQQQRRQLRGRQLRRAERPGHPHHVVLGSAGGLGTTKFLHQSIANYEAAHPNVTIKPVLQSTDNLMPNFAAAAKAKKGPDIEYRWGGIWALQDAWDGNLAPVSDYIPEAEWSHYLNASEDT